MKIGQEQQADEVKSGEEDGGANGAEMAEQIFVDHQADPAAGTRRPEVEGSAIQNASVRTAGVGCQFGEGIQAGVQIEEADTAEQQDGRPDPAAMEVGHELEEITQAETKEEDWQDKSAGAEPKEQPIAEPGADLPDPIVSVRIGVGAVGGDVLGIIGK